MRPLKSLTLEAMIGRLSAAFGRVPDDGAANLIDYPMHDTLMSGLAMMFFQHPSLLPFQRVMKQNRKRCNLETIFGVQDVPSDTQMREILDGVPIEPVRRLVPELFEGVRRAGWATQFKIHLPTGQHRGDYYTLAVDGSDYLHSTRIQCPGCLRWTDAEGTVHYRHLVVGATLSASRVASGAAAGCGRSPPQQGGRHTSLRDHCREAADGAGAAGASADEGHRHGG